MRIDLLHPLGRIRRGGRKGRCSWVLFITTASNRAKLSWENTAGSPVPLSHLESLLEVMEDWARLSPYLEKSEV